MARAVRGSPHGLRPRQAGLGQPRAARAREHRLSRAQVQGPTLEPDRGRAQRALDAGQEGRDGLGGLLVALKRVIPCLDVDAGRVVKGTNFVGLRDAGDPVELAARYDSEGADEVVFLDITASHERRETILELARRTADNVFIPFVIGGGIRSAADAQAVLDAGADKVSVNSAALARPALLSELADQFGAQCVVIAIDAKAEADGSWGV